MPEIIIHKDIYNDVYYEFLKCLIPEQILFGGASSGKSKFIAQRAVEDLLDGHRNYLVVRKVKDTLRGSSYAEMVKVINEWGLQRYFNMIMSPMEITCIPTKMQAQFHGLDNVEKIKSATPVTGVFTDRWEEEATEITEADHDQLDFRMRGGSERIIKRTTMSFNPINRQHWIFKRYNFEHFTKPKQTTEDLLILHTTYKDNRFLTKQDIKRIESKTGFFHSVYALGEWGVLGDLIFTNWRVEDLTEKRKELSDKIKFGLDFGYSSDPAALFGGVHYKDKIYVFNEFYHRGMTNQQLANAIKPIVNDSLVWCDSAEPKSIAELRTAGIRAYPVKKSRALNLISNKKSSILYGIQWLQGKEIIVDTKCIQMQNELSLYQWQKDKYGASIPLPSDSNNHLIDALRYAFERDMSGTSVAITTMDDIKEGTGESIAA